MRLQPGLRFGNRYELTRPIAVGGMGAVWEATDTTLRRAVAIKVLKPELSSDPTFLARFRAEARHSGSLSHPNIAAVFDYGESSEPGGVVSAYLVMELVPGEPLSHVFLNEGSLSPEWVLDFMGQVGSGLAAAHRAGIVHRDIKPGNLLLTPDGRVKITDFGIARAINSVPLTQTGTVMGTARYLSPEQATGEQLSSASDIYSLGVVAYEALTGETPFPVEGQVAQAMAHVNDEPPPLPESIPWPLRDLVMRMLAKYPEERPRNGAALVAAVKNVARQLHAGESGTAATSVLAREPRDAAGPNAPGTQTPGSNSGSDSATTLLGGPVHGGALTGDPTVVQPASSGSSASAGAQANPTRAFPATSPRPTAQPPGRGTAQPPPASFGSSSRPTPAGPPAGRQSRPETTVTPSSKPRRRRMSGPLLALIALVLFVAIGAIVAKALQSSNPPPVAPTVTVTQTQSSAPTTSQTTPSTSTSSSTTQTSTGTPTTATSSSSSSTTTSSETDTGSGTSTSTGTGTGSSATNSTGSAGGTESDGATHGSQGALAGSTPTPTTPPTATPPNEGSA